MNRIIVDKESLQPDGTVVLTGEAARHVLCVLRKGPGDRLRLGIASGASGLGEIVEVAGGAVRCRFHPQDRGPGEPPIDLVVALPRPVMLRRIFTQAAPLGVARIYCIRSGRVEKSYFQSPVLDPERRQELLRRGMAQAMTTWQPQVVIVPRFRRFVEEILPDLAGRASLAILLHPGSTASLAQAAPLPFRGRTLAVIGPEGGWLPHEVELLTGCGLHPVGLGPRILRVDTAVAFLAGQVELLRHLPPPAQTRPASR